MEVTRKKEAELKKREEELDRRWVICLEQTKPLCECSEGVEVLRGQMRSWREGGFFKCL